MQCKQYACVDAVIVCDAVVHVDDIDGYRRVMVELVDVVKRLMSLQ